MIVFIGIILALFLATILMSKTAKTMSDRILLTWLISIAITLLLYTFHSDDFRYKYPIFLGWAFPFPLVHWPLLYLYVSSLTSVEKPSKKSILHFIPFLLSIALFWRYLVLTSNEKLAIFENHGKGYEIEITINLIAIISSAVIYTVLSSYKLWKYRQTIKNEYSYSEKITLTWLFYLILAMTVILVVILITPTDVYVYSSVTGVVLYIGYFGIKQVGIFHQTKVFEQPTTLENESEILQENAHQTANNQHTEHISDAEAPKMKYEKSTVSDDEIQRIHARLTDLMNNEQLYKNPQLSLLDVAQKIPIHPNILSQVINSVEGKNFYDYVNFQRIEEFKRLVSLPENKQFTFLSLAYDCGFNSKTSFNRNFKKVTSLAPSDYLKLHEIDM